LSENIQMYIDIENIYNRMWALINLNF